MKDNIIALAIVLAIYSAVIWGIPFALGIEVLPYWQNAFDLFFIPILIYFIFRKDGIYSILKDTHQFNKEQVKQEEELKRTEEKIKARKEVFKGLQPLKVLA